MKVTLVIVLAVLACAGSNIGQAQESSQQQPTQQTPKPEVPQSGAAPATPQQGTPPSTQPCAPSKDTCELSEPAPQQPAAAPASKPQEQTQTPAAPKNSKSNKSKSHRHKVAKKQPADSSGPKKTVVRDGGTSDPATVLTPGTSASNSRQLTEDLLSATDANLKQATSRPLNADQEETVNQIKLFMEQASDAIKAGDLSRGHNLAMKAHLLSDDLVNQK